jgi:AraC family transcriptional regulator of adaptative response/methylated-DNA-[protein]-cysteine methyltransferase
MNQAFIDHQHYKIVSQAILYIRSNAHDQPSLKQIAEHVSMSEYHLQRVFSSWAGVSPKRYLQFITKEYALQKLHESDDILSVAIDTGLSGTGRLHDLMVTCEAMSPGEIKSLGENLLISYGQANTPFGEALLAWTDRGICHFEFCDDDFEIKKLAFINRWSMATISEDDGAATKWSAVIFSQSSTAESMSVKGKKSGLNLVVQGTNFQLKVWQALLKSKPAQRLSYSQLATLAGVPKAQRAVGSAMAANSIAYLIPCHRVIKSDGETGHYRWGANRKITIQGWEEATLQNDQIDNQ